MICRKCGELLKDTARVCPVCGATQSADGGTTVNPTHRESADCAHEGHTKRAPRKRAKKSRIAVLIPLLLAFATGILEEVETSEWAIGLVVVIFVLAALAALVSVIWQSVKEARDRRSNTREEDCL